MLMQGTHDLATPMRGVLVCRVVGAKKHENEKQI